MKSIDSVGSIPGAHWDVPNNCQLWLGRDGCSPGWLSFGLLRLNKSSSLYSWFRMRYSWVISVLGLTLIPLRLHLHLSWTPLLPPGTSLLAPLQAFCSSSSQNAKSLASAPRQFLTAAFPSQSIVFWYQSADFGANPGTREQKLCSSARWLPGGGSAGHPQQAEVLPRAQSSSSASLSACVLWHIYTYPVYFISTGTAYHMYIFYVAYHLWLLYIYYHIDILYLYLFRDCMKLWYINTLHNAY